MTFTSFGIWINSNQTILTTDPSIFFISVWKGVQIIPKSLLISFALLNDNKSAGNKRKMFPPPLRLHQNTNLILHVVVPFRYDPVTFDLLPFRCESWSKHLKSFKTFIANHQKSPKQTFPCFRYSLHSAINDLNIIQSRQKIFYM